MPNSHLTAPPRRAGLRAPNRQVGNSVKQTKGRANKMNATTEHSGNPANAENFAARPRGPVDAVRTCLVKFFDFRGRASRSEFWWFFALFLAVWLLPASAKAAVWLIDIVPDSAIQPMLAALFFFNNLIIRVPLWAVAVRRLHDINFRGWWILLDIVNQLSLIAPTAYILYRTGGILFESGETAQDIWYRVIFEPAVLSLPPKFSLTIANALIVSDWVYYGAVAVLLGLCLIKGKPQRNRFDRGTPSESSFNLPSA